MESHLLSSLQEMITTSIGSLKSTTESEFKVLQCKVIDLIECVKILESGNDRVGELLDRLHQLETSLASHSVPPRSSLITLLLMLTFLLMSLSSHLQLPPC